MQTPRELSQLKFQQRALIRLIYNIMFVFDTDPDYRLISQAGYELFIDNMVIDWFYKTKILSINNIFDEEGMFILDFIRKELIKFSGRHVNQETFLEGLIQTLVKCSHYHS